MIYQIDLDTVFGLKTIVEISTFQKCKMTQTYKTYQTDCKLPAASSVESWSGGERVYSRSEKWTLGLLIGAVSLSIVLGVTLTFFIITDGKLFLKDRRNQPELLNKAVNGSATDDSSPDQKTSNFCDSPACEEAAQNMKKNMNEAVDPCHDFYKFACGNYMKEEDLPESELVITPRIETVNSIIRGLLDELESDSDEASRAFKVAKTYYKSCLEQDEDVQSLKNLLEDYGGWPVVEGNQWKSTSHQKLLYKNAENGISTNFIFDVFVDLDWKDPERTKIYIDQPSFGMASRLYFLEDLHEGKMQAYLSFQSKMATLLGADGGKDTKNALKKSLQFEINLVNVSQNADERRNKSKLYNPMSLKHLQKITKNTSWKEYIERVLGLKELPDDEEIIVMCPKYLEKIEKILKKTPKRDVANYIIWRIILESTEYMSSKKVNKIYSKFSKSLRGESGIPVRNMYCGKILSRNLPLLSLSLIHRNVRRNHSKSRSAEEIVDYVKIALQESMESVTWMAENSTMTKAKSKLSSIKYFFSGIREKTFDLKFLDRYYKKLHLKTKDSFSNNQRKVVKLKTKQLSQLIKGESDDSSVLAERKSHPFHIFYLPEENAVHFPKSMLDEHGFQPNQSKFLTFGSLGTAAGFGLSQSLDDIGRQFTDKGALKMWWDKTSLVEYKDRMMCIAKQYKNMFERDNISIPTRKSRGKNWSDLQGLSAAYKAYQNWKEENSDEQTLPQLNYTTNQLFWISFAQRFCTKTTNFTQYTINLINESNCLPGKYRVNGPLQNLEEFAKDWKCPSQSKMNPKNKCLI